MFKNDRKVAVSPLETFIEEILTAIVKHYILDICYIFHPIKKALINRVFRESKGDSLDFCLKAY